MRIRQKLRKLCQFIPAGLKARLKAVFRKPPQHLFDAAWYLRQLPELDGTTINPLQHYLQHGAQQGLDPHPLFETRWYLETYPDIAQAGINPLQHYLEHGYRERRNPSLYFDAAWYLTQYPEVARTGQNPVIHYLQQGHTGAYNPNPYFDSAWYIRAYLAQQPVPVNPLMHYLTEGAQAGHAPNPQFDARWYRAQIDQPKLPALLAFRHYLSANWQPGSIPAPNEPLFRSLADLEQCLAGSALSETPVPATLSLPLASVQQLLEYSQTTETGVVYQGESGVRGSVDLTLAPAPPRMVQLRDVYLLAGTRYLAGGDSWLVHDEEYKLHNVAGAALKYHAARRSAPGQIDIKVKLQKAMSLDTGINLMHEYSNNYFHFLTEILPRLILAEQADLPAGVPYLVEDNLHENIQQLYDLALRDHPRPVVRLSPGTLFHCRELYMPSDPTIVVDAYHGGPVSRQSCLDIGRMREAVARCRQAFPSAPGARRRRIFATRNSNYRRLLNLRELESRFVALGFEIVDAGQLNLEAQIRLFQEAEIVVGPTGAQMANIVWCQPGTRAIVLASDHPSHQLYLWELLGQASGTEVRIVQGPRAYHTDGLYGVHDDYTVDPAELLAGI